MNEPEMVPCDHVIAKLWEYIDGELSAENDSRVRAHLDICSRCFPQYDFQRAYKELVRRTAQQPMPPTLQRRVFEAILEEEARSTAAREGQGLRRRVRRLIRSLFGGSG